MRLERQCAVNAVEPIDDTNADLARYAILELVCCKVVSNKLRPSVS